MTHIFHRHTKLQYPTAAKGDGCYLIDTEGKRYLDACGGAAVSCLGHSNEAVRQAIHQQVDQVAYAHTNYFTTEVAEKLADLMAELAPEGLDRVYYVSGGSEAVEAALKLVRQYHLEIGKPEKRHLITRWQSYHGNTLGALSAGGNRWRRGPYAPLLTEAHHISPCYAYRGQEPGETEEEYGLRVANELEAKVLELGPENVAAFIAEPVVGATMGAVPAVKGYLKRIREICTQYDVIMILDEVMCGTGRTGSWFACEQDGVVPDLLTMAKGLGAGYQPIGAVMVAGKVYDAIASGSGFFQHGHTYIGHATACAASLAVLNEIRKHDLLKNVQERGRQLRQELEERFSDHPYVGNIRGRGLMQGIELVQDRDTKEPIDPEQKVHAAIKAEGMKQGIMCYPMGGTIDGKRGNHILLAPPYIITESEVSEIVEKMASVIDAVLLP